MGVPEFHKVMLPLLRLTADGKQHSLADAVERLAVEFALSDPEKNELLKTGGTRLYNRVGWGRTYLVKAGLLEAVGPGRFQITDGGRDCLLILRPK